MGNETGEYRCSYRNLSVEEGKTSVSVYVFVQGEFVLFFVDTQYKIAFLQFGTLNI